MDELIVDFLNEVQESLSTIDNELINLEKDPSNKDAITSVFRILHTIKGTAGFIGLNNLQKIAHSGENILGKIRDGEMPANGVNLSLVFESIDIIRSIVDVIQETSAEPAELNQSFIDRATAAENGQLPPAETAATSATAFPVAAELDLIGDGMSELPEFTSGLNTKSDEGNAAPSAAPASATPFPVAAELDLIGDGMSELPEFTSGVNKKSEDEKSAAPAVAAAAPAIAAPIAQPKEEKPKAAEAGHGVDKAATESIRVRINLLDSLMQGVSELVLTRNQLLQSVKAKNIDPMAIKNPIQRLNILTSELQENIMKTRMQPIGSIWASYPRVIRDLAKDLGKKINLEMDGENTELDKQLIESIKDPLMHMIRNSADHGIEMPQKRIDAGKPEIGTLKLSANHQGGSVVITISDDGAGIGVERIRAKLVEKGIFSEADAAAMTKEQLQLQIFNPGFSTAEKITGVSGRGVGMDVAKSNIEKIGGVILVQSVEGKGTTFTVKVPLTLAIIPVLIVDCDNLKYAIPMLNVQEIIKVTSSSEFHIDEVNGSQMIKLRNGTIPLISLAEKLGKGESDSVNEKFIVVCHIAHFVFGVIVHKVYDIEEIVVKPLCHLLHDLKIYSGVTILGDGNVVMILDPINISSEIFHNNALDNDENKRYGLSEDLMISKMLVFEPHAKGEQRLIPMDMVNRLEEIDVTKIETVLGQNVIQYRDILMKLVSTSPHFVIPESGYIDLIVCGDGYKMIGLMVHNLLDIINHELDNKIIKSDDPETVGAIVVNGKAMEIINLHHYFKVNFGDGAEYELNKAVGASDKNKVLLIDDSAFFRKFIPPVITSAGYDVITVDSVDKAIHCLEDVSNDISIVVTDINMPVKTGLDLVDYIKASEKLLNTPVIALSAFNPDEINRQKEKNSSMMKFDAFIPKTHHSKLIEKIKEFIG